MLCSRLSLHEVNRFGMQAAADGLSQLMIEKHLKPLNRSLSVSRCQLKSTLRPRGFPQVLSAAADDHRT